jgi:ribosomal protein L16 Arg81 hydroxylase
LFPPQTVEEFLGEYWPDRPFVAHGDPARLPAVFAVPELSSFEALAQKYNGNILLFTNGRKCQKMIMINAVNPALLFEMGLALQFEDIEPCVPGAAAFLRQLERGLGIHDGSLSMSAFVSPAPDGLSCHYDAHDVISVQLLGGPSAFTLRP